MRTGRRVRGAALAMMLCLAVFGCATRNATVASAFPQGTRATPWILTGSVWSGSFAEAAPALGPDAEEWRPFGPQRVWLAVYGNEQARKGKLTLRAFSFDSLDGAQKAFERFRAPDAKAFVAGDDGCWTDIGVLFRWGRLVFDIFGSDATLQSQVDAAVLAAFVQKDMPAGLPDAPR